jgi:hypothetical protein
MKTSAVIFLMGLLLGPMGYGQHSRSESHEMLEWNEFYQISWEDFEGKPSKDSRGDAATAVKIKAVPHYFKDQLRYDVYAYFNRKASWARGHSDALLKHEQLHFDIAELYARKIRKKISDLSERGVKDVQVINKAINDLMEESNEIDQRYDLETLHGALSKKQQAWEKMVKEQLAGLKDYKKKKRVITIGKDLRKQPLIFGSRQRKGSSSMRG